VGSRARLELGHSARSIGPAREPVDTGHEGHKSEGAPDRGSFHVSRFELLDRTDVRCLLALGAIHDVELDFLALVEGLVAVATDR
jgi:hypothetical protein